MYIYEFIGTTLIKAIAFSSTSLLTCGQSVMKEILGLVEVLNDFECNLDIIAQVNS